MPRASMGRGRALFLLVALLGFAAATTGQDLAQLAGTDAASQAIESLPAAAATGSLSTYTLPPGTQFIHTVTVDGVIVAEKQDQGVHDTDADGLAFAAEAAGSGKERLIYSNTLGRVAVDFGANRLISDDIATTALTGCALSRFAFDVDGRVNEALAGGPYTVTWALYNTCPYAVSSGLPRNGRIILGTAGMATLEDDAPRTIEVVLPEPVSSPTHVWLGLTFNRSNAGAIVGAPAMVGFSGDVFDFPGSACNANLGGFPSQPHGSFNVQMWGVDCTEVNLKYQNRRESGAAFTNRANQWITDDVTLLATPCLLRGYSVGVRGSGMYDFELRESCEGPVVAGTERTQFVSQSSGQEPRIFDYTLDPPILLPESFVYAVRTSNGSSGPIHTAIYPRVGHTADVFALPDEDCQAGDYFPAQQDGLFFSVVCDGPAPLGACCDMYMTQCAGGPYDGELCGAYSIEGCSPGTCESVCREVPQINCPFPPRFTLLQPEWDEGKTCASDSDPEGAFPGHTCGQAACCTPDDTCLNLTKNECEAYPPVDEPHHWQMGSFCGEDEQYCPHAACLHTPGTDKGACYFANDTPGCRNAECCELVCAADSWCCRVEWDRGCLEWAAALCDGAPANDSCGPAPFHYGAGAFGITANSSITFTNREAFFDAQDGTACSLPSAWCVDANGAPMYTCSDAGECDFGGACAPVGYPAPNNHTVWFTFTATHTSAQVGTCNSPAAQAASIHVFAVADLAPGQRACDHLSLLSCIAADGCGTSEQACLCVEGLTVGSEYYVVIGSRYHEPGIYQLDITSPCDGARCCPRDDCNNNCVSDVAELATGSPDCNANDIPDDCDLAADFLDCDFDGKIDWCEALACPAIPPGQGTLFYYQADFDCDSDLFDFAAFQNCFDPLSSGNLGCCRIMDAWPRDDGFIDLHDYFYLCVAAYGCDG